MAEWDDGSRGAMSPGEGSAACCSKANNREMRLVDRQAGLPHMAALGDDPELRSKPILAILAPPPMVLWARKRQTKGKAGEDI